MNKKELLSIRDEMERLIKRIDRAIAVVDSDGNPIVIGGTYRHQHSGFFQVITRIIDGDIVETRFVHNGMKTATAAKFLKRQEPTLADAAANEVYFLAGLQYWKNEDNEVFWRNENSGVICRASGSADHYKIGEYVGNIKDLRFERNRDGNA